MSRGHFCLFWVFCLFGLADQKFVPLGNKTLLISIHLQTNAKAKRKRLQRELKISTKSMLRLLPAAVTSVVMMPFLTIVAIATAPAVAPRIDQMQETFHVVTLLLSFMLLLLVGNHRLGPEQ